jgi:hypothetical protein
MVADSEVASTQTANAERARAVKALKADLRDKETELDGLIKSLIDYPPKVAEQPSPADDPKRVLKGRITELTTLVNTLREQLSALEANE